MESKTSTTYRKVSIPSSLIETVEELIEKNLISYRSPSEFVIDTVRRRLDELQAYRQVPAR